MNGYYDEYGNWIEGPTPEQMGTPPEASYTPPPQGPPIQWGQMNPPHNVDGGWSDEHTGGYTPANGGNQAGYMDLSYWASRGVPADQIFDFATGQPRPGWTRTANGYERASSPSAAATPAPPQSYPSSTGSPQDWGYLTQPFERTPPSWREWSPSPQPNIVKPPPFTYKEFQAPTLDSVYADPSYQFRKGEGEQALSNRIASTGAYRTGGVLKDFINYNQNAASQEYSNIFGRATDAHNLGLNQALGTYATNWGVDRDVLDREIDIWGAKNTALQRENELVNRRDMDSFLAEFDIFERNRRRAGDYLFGAAGLDD